MLRNGARHKSTDGRTDGLRAEASSLRNESCSDVTRGRTGARKTIIKRALRTLRDIAAIAAIVIAVLAAMLLAAILTGGHGYGP